MAKARRVSRHASSALHTVANGGFTTKVGSDGWVGIQKAVKGVGAGKRERTGGFLFCIELEESILGILTPLHSHPRASRLPVPWGRQTSINECADPYSGDSRYPGTTMRA